MLTRPTQAGHASWTRSAGCGRCLRRRSRRQNPRLSTLSFATLTLRGPRFPHADSGSLPLTGSVVPPTGSSVRKRTDDTRSAREHFVRLQTPSGEMLATQLSARQRCAAFAKPSLVRSIWQLTHPLPTFALLWRVMAWTVQAQWHYGWTLLLALPAAGLYVRLFIIQHDCSHGSYFASRRAKHWAGAGRGVGWQCAIGRWQRWHSAA